MGKASKWMMNFLLGKKEEKDKKKDICLSEEYVTSTPTAIIPMTPTYKRRWSFGRSTKKERSHKSSKSLDSITNIPLVTHAIVELEKPQSNNMTLLVANTSATKTVMATTHAASGRSKTVKDAAATKIQAAFRSYLARRALCALRGLVKLQAQVRGHLVRKQTTATLRSMHALMAIQVRARCQRIQMADKESQHVAKSQSSRHRNSPQDNGFKRVHKEAIDINLYESRGVLKSKHGYLNHSQIERSEHGVTTFYSGDLSISKQEHQYEEFSFTTAQNSPHNYPTMSIPTPGRASFSFEQPNYVHSMCHDYPVLQPNYMANTESSRAKVRSQSEPKQRPKLNVKPITNRNASIDGRKVSLDAQSQHSPSPSKHIAHENQDPWFVKLYRSTRSAKDSECHANSSTTSHSNYCNSLIAYEPHLTLY